MQKLSLKNIILIAVAAAIIVASFIVSKYENRAYTGTAQINAQGNQNSSELPVIAASSTSDNSIAYSGDWEKTLSTTIVGAWNSSSTMASTSANQPLTPTDQFGRKIFAQYAQAQNSGEDVSDPNVQSAIVQQALADGTVLPGPRVYTAKDVKIINDNSNAALLQFGTAVGTIFANDQSNGTNLETNIVQNSMNSNDPTILKQLDPFISSYQKIVNDLIATPAPSAMASMHVNLINAMNELLFADQSFKKIYTDALTGLAGVSAYKQGIRDLPQSLLAMKEYFVAKKITFDQSGGGKIFNIQK